MRSVQDQAQFVVQPCDGLAHAIELGDAARVRSLYESYWEAIRTRADVDTLVLGCTHYALDDDVLREVVGPQISLVEPGPAMARRVTQLLAETAA
jgi:glutamate racemase